MKINSFWYCLGQGFRNIARNRWYSIASCATMAACIFMLSISYAIIVNVASMVTEAETNLGVTVFFDEGLTENEILQIGNKLVSRPEVANYRYISADEAWEQMKQKYFEDTPELAEGFEDNPLINSASYEIFLTSVDEQEDYVAYLKTVEGVRKVNYSAATVGGLTVMNRIITIVSSLLILLLLLITVFLISNTIALAINVRRDEIRIMRLIGATSLFIRAPFVMEGILIGSVGAAIPLGVMVFVYKNAMTVFSEKLGVFSSLFQLLPLAEVFRILVPLALLLGIGIGFLGSEVSVRRNLHV